MKVKSIVYGAVAGIMFFMVTAPLFSKRKPRTRNGDNMLLVKGRPPWIATPTQCDPNAETCWFRDTEADGIAIIGSCRAEDRVCQGWPWENQPWYDCIDQYAPRFTYATHFCTPDRPHLYRKILSAGRGRYYATCCKLADEYIPRSEVPAGWY